MKTTRRGHRLAPSLADVDLDVSLGREAYERRLARGQLRLLYLQRHLLETGNRAVFVFEGWDAAGKGGAIRRLTEKLDPRSVRVHPIGAPDLLDHGRHYLHRFWARLPRAGRLVIFDRSWYGRVLVERVERLCTPAEWQRAYAEIEDFEQLLIHDGVPILKFFLHISKREQLKRFREREKDPFKRWKITPDDWRNREKWAAYRKATDEMLARTHTRLSPWHVVAGESKKHARIQVIETTIERLGHAFGVDTERLPPAWRAKDRA